MATKSKSERGIIWSIVALTIAALSIGYCFSHIIDLISNGVERSSRAIAYLTRLVKGSV
ncbi:hypothetical protein MHZ95_06320 [Sporosarcina sp. ACRSM]|uniref:hypothetical protein n=1 Tax=Sporosarcina sp. ACRSM TaxID=2918216 RepID=UPI001EF67A52|nr:hypothetical protein [Sporosarcina sp. ACRSM]MCG7334885.1 hypothetical protein [Sporosarcina sp. ACRSM]